MTHLLRMCLGLLPLMTWCAWFAVVWQWNVKRYGQTPLWREVILQTIALGGAWIVIGTESLSLFSAIGFGTILVWWLLALGIALVLLFKNRCLLRGFFSAWQRPTTEQWFILVPLLGLCLCSFISATCSPPNNADSLTYHLPRQVIWMQRGNLDFYPTVNLRQIMMSPFSEYVGLHLMVLSDSDRFHPLVQWSAMIAMLLATSLLTKKLGGNTTIQLLACLILAAAPIVFHQASNTKNDVVTGMWIAMAAWWIFRLLDEPEMDWYRALLLGLALGGAVLTKGTGALYAMPLIALLGWLLLKRWQLRYALFFVFIGLVALSLNLPFFARNYHQFGHISGPRDQKEGGYNIYNTNFGPSAIVSNVVRTLVWQATLPSDDFNAWLMKETVWLHKDVLHWNLDDPSTTTSYSPFGRLMFRVTDEDRSGAPAHIYLFLLLFPALLFMPAGTARRRAVLLMVMASMGLLIFCIALRWQEFNVRYFVAITALFAPVLAVVLTARAARFMIPFLTYLFVITILPGVWSNSRPIFSPASIFARDGMTQRFYYVGYSADFVEAAEIAAHAHATCVGLATDGDFKDYLVMKLMMERMQPCPFFEYVGASVRIPEKVHRKADMIVAQPSLTSLTDPLTGVHYQFFRQYALFNILLPEGKADDSALPAFYGWDRPEGITGIMGPYPQWDLPRVRWGAYPRTSVRVQTRQAGAYELHLSMRRNDSIEQAIVIKMDGQALFTFKFGTPFEFHKFTLPVRLTAGDHELTFDYANGEADNNLRRAVLFETLQVTPAGQANATQTAKPGG